MRLPRPLLIALLAAGLVAGLLAGCTGPPADDGAVARAVAAAALPSLVVQHDGADGHRHGELHNGSANLEVVGYSNGFDGSGDPNRIPANGWYNEVALTPQHALLSRTSSDGRYGGFSVVDISDPAHPAVVSSFDAPGGSDIEVSADGRLAFFATQRNSPEQVVNHVAAHETVSSSLPRGIYLVDLADIKNPAQAAFVPLPYNGPHTLTYVAHPNGHEYLLACTYDLVTDPGTGAIMGAVPATQRLLAFEVVRGASVPGLPTPPPSLEPVAHFQILDSAGPGRLVFPHDARVEVRSDGQVLIHLAYWDKGVRVLDFTDPPRAGAVDAGATPALREIASFTDFSPSAQNNIHLVKPFDVPVRGKTVLVAEPEIISAAHETGQITLLDASNPSSLTRLGWWNLTHIQPDLGVRDLDFSPHNFDTFGTHVALAHYHAGLWVLDASDPNHPRESGFYMPGKAPNGLARRDSPTLSPNVWSVEEQGGLLFMTDEATGLHILRYTGP